MLGGMMVLVPAPSRPCLIALAGLVGEKGGRKAEAKGEAVWAWWFRRCRGRGGGAARRVVPNAEGKPPAGKGKGRRKWASSRSLAGQQRREAITRSMKRC